MHQHMSSVVFAPGALLCAAALIASAVTVSEKHYRGDGGTTVYPLYINGHCRFVFITPEGWTLDTAPGGGRALLLSPAATNAVSLVVENTPVSVAERAIEQWRIDDFKKQLGAGRMFAIERERVWPVDQTRGWQVWGADAVVEYTASGMPRTNLFIERHSYHIKFGYLHHVWFRAPEALATAYQAVFDFACQHYLADDGQ
ncbi:hypothetical protein GX586_04160 [bacterium]|nr:hypothetical protein [bacterium]